MELTPVEVTQIYQSIASGGYRTPLRAIREVMDQAGRIVLELPIAPQVDLSGLPAGIYLVRLVERSGVSQFERLVVR